MLELHMCVSVILEMASKRTHGDSSDESNDDKRSQATAVIISKKKFTGSKTYKVTFNPISTSCFGWCSTGGCFPPPSITPLSLKLDCSNFVQNYVGIR